jgi:hypothetical protein
LRWKGLRTRRSYSLRSRERRGWRWRISTT